MTNKKSETTKAAQPSKELLTAYEIHTLAQLTYHHLAEAHPWIHPSHGSSLFTQPEVWPPERGFEPVPTWSAAPWMH